MDVKKIGVLHLNQIGDLVFSLPLLKALREAYPEAAIHSILRTHLKDLLLHSPYIDEVIDRKRGAGNSIRLLRRIRQNSYDLLITLSNSFECLFLTQWSGARIKAGFRHPPWDLGLDFKETVEGHHSWYNNVKLLRKLNIDVQKTDYVGLLALPAREQTGSIANSSPFSPQGEYAVFSPGASARRKVKAWEDTKFAELILLLEEHHHLTPVLVGGKEDQDAVERIMASVRAKDAEGKVCPIVNLAGKTGLRDLCYVLRGARLFVGVDSGIMHLASSFDIPVVGIFGPSDPFYVGPLNTRSTVVREELECIPCYLKGCEARECMRKLEVQKVFNACRQVLGA